MAMNPQARQRSILLEESSKAIAEWTVLAHADRDASLERRYGADWHSRWSDEIHQRLRHLAQAIAMESSSLFVESVRWARAGFVSRDVPVEDLQASLDCMNVVIDQNLPPVVAEFATEYVRAALDRLDVETEPDVNSNADTHTHHANVAILLESALCGRRREAEALVIAEMDRGRSIKELFEGLLQPFLVEIGRMWHRNEITIAEEHAATAVAESAMAVMRSRIPIIEGSSNRVVATSIAGELHALGVRMVADLFELDGWNVLYLGSNMPQEDIVHALRAHEAQLLAASVTSMLNLRALGDLIDMIRAQPDLTHVRVLVGGRPLANDASVWRRLGADGYAESAADAVRIGHELMNDA